MYYCYKGYVITDSREHGCWLVYRHGKCYGTFSTAQDAEDYITGKENETW